MAGRTDLGPGPGGAPADLQIPIALGLSGGAVFLDYDASLIDAEQAETAIETLAFTAEQLASNLNRPLQDIDTVLPRDRALLSAWRGPTLAPDASLTVHGLFARRVAASGDAPALVHGTTTLTYADLDRRANEMAARLQALGVSAGATVSVALPRSPDSIVAVLGILKAGAAYLPLDLSYPSDRIAFMLDDGGASAVVTTEAHRALFPQRLPVLSIDAAASPNPACHGSPLPAAATRSLTSCTRRARPARRKASRSGTNRSCASCSTLRMSISRPPSRCSTPRRWASTLRRSKSGDRC